MLYKKNGEKELSNELFKNPTSEYRGAPFWAWNCKLNKDILKRQIGYLQEMGFGGFHMHSRSGMATEYLSEDFMDLVRTCVEEGKKRNMLSWLYDEDRWSSGSAGGLVTKDVRLRAKWIRFTENKMDNAVSQEEGIEKGLPYLLACFDICLNPDGTLKSEKLIDENAEAIGKKRRAYVITDGNSGWYNGQGYVDTLSKKAIQKFIEITYEAYKKSVGDEFGKSINSIFTDEPHFTPKETLTTPQSDKDIIIPWTTDLADTFKETYGYDIIEHIPELLWDLPDGKISVARYNYHDHLCERFTTAFSDQCGEWCAKNNIYLTGHMLSEPKLVWQTMMIGEAMRAYRSFGIPGIDMLCNDTEYSTAKQAQSASHQFGREGVTSELYGVTNWDFDFRGHKFQGDWQAALGVTARVPHLSWVSMKGSAKRDYPASINYQSPWFREYPYVEDHFARLNTALTRGKAKVKVGVIHPIESLWIHFGPNESTSAIREQLESNFQNLISWLIFGLIDFDFISESLLPGLCKNITDELEVGEMKYSTILVPACETIRSSTLEILNKFKAKGGNVIFMGECPKYIDARESTAVKPLYDSSEKAQISRTSVLKALESERLVSVIGWDGKLTDNLIYNLREDNDAMWLFVAHGKVDYYVDEMAPQWIKIVIKGEYTPVLYNTITGETEEPEFKVINGNTEVYKIINTYDSVLLKLCKVTKRENKFDLPVRKPIKMIDFKDKVSYRREEDNVYVLDMARYSIDGGAEQPIEETLRIDGKVRDQLHFVRANGCDSQPWVIKETKPVNFVTLTFDIESEIDVKHPFLAYEEAEEIILNGENVDIKPIGYFVDEAINKIELPPIKRGTNVLSVKMPINNRISLENCYLLGDFDVRVDGCVKVITAPSHEIAFDSLVTQGMPFYGGNVIYTTEIDTPDCTVDVRTSCFRANLIKVIVDDKDVERIAYAPYTATFKLDEGHHKVEFVSYGNRINTFGALHYMGRNNWYGPDMWYSQGDSWSYQYRLHDTGILKSPEITVFE